MVKRILVMCVCTVVCMPASCAMDGGGNEKAWTTITNPKKNIRKKNASKPKNMGNKDFIRACLQGNISKVHQLIGCVDINGQTAEDFNALSAASINGHVDIIKDLFTAGADVHQSNKKGQTALFAAAAHGRLDAAVALIEHGADVNQVCAQGSTPLMYASGAAAVPVVELFVGRGAQVNRQDWLKGRTPLHWALRGRDGSVQKRAFLHNAGDVLETLKVLLKKGANPNLSDNEGHSPVYWANYLSCWEEKALLLSYTKVNK